LTKRKSEDFDIFFSNLPSEGKSVENWWINPLKLANRLENRTLSTKNFPQFQQFKMWKIKKMNVAFFW
jgi:hypothetical protein